MSEHTISDPALSAMAPSAAHGDSASEQFFKHSTAKRVNTDAVITAAIAEQYPQLELVIAPVATCNLLSYAAAGHAAATLVEDGDSVLPTSLKWTVYLPAARRLDGGRGGLAEQLHFGKFLYRWGAHEFVIYVVDGRDGTASYPQVTNQYILTANPARARELLLAAGRWSVELREEVWVFDQGFWQKSRELFDSIRGASWDSVILDSEMKKALVEDHLSFFESRAAYAALKVPWKRGIIYYGPPGNGKTISIKAMMRTLYNLKDPIPTLYVRTLASFSGPEASIKQIFQKARQYAPCYLVFEDLDTIVSDGVRSYFLNEVDGLKANDGIFMIGSTNHLDRLDPGISKRPSRFDRKYYFGDPNLDERIAYCHFWQSKLADNKDVDFPDELCKAIAEFTDDFSFAYMQEAFVAALLVIARQTKSSDEVEVLAEEMDNGWVGVLNGWKDDLEKNVLWREIKKQIEILREGMEEKRKQMAKESVCQ